MNSPAVKALAKLDAVIQHYRVKLAEAERVRAALVVAIRSEVKTEARDVRKAQAGDHD